MKHFPLLKIKLTLLKKITLILSFLSFHPIFAASPKKIDPTTTHTSSKKIKPVDSTKMEKVKLSNDEYLISYDSKQIIFKTKSYENLELSENCFKKNKPDCLAYKSSLTGTREKHEKHMISPTHNNMAAIHCALIKGENIVVKTSQNNETDFCEFKDGSRVSSWSSYYKTNSVQK